MTTGTPLATALWEADRHLDTLEPALRDWLTAPAANLRELETDPERLRILDQLLFRFSKLQDALGIRLVPATLAALAEPFEEWPMIDRLNRLEKLGALIIIAARRSGGCVVRPSWPDGIRAGSPDYAGVTISLPA